MKKAEVCELPNFEYTPKGFSELKAALKSGKIVKNPFAKFYGNRVKVNIIQDEKSDVVNY